MRVLLSAGAGRDWTFSKGGSLFWLFNSQAKRGCSYMRAQIAADHVQQAPPAIQIPSSHLHGNHLFLSLIMRPQCRHFSARELPISSASLFPRQKKKKEALLFGMSNRAPCANANY